MNNFYLLLHRLRLSLIFVVFFLLSAAALNSQIQPTTFQDPLVNHMAGKWVLRGTIGGNETTHDVDAAWVLGHQYLQIHEVSRERDSTGAAVYEAIVYLGWDAPSARYSCLWLDVTGGGGLSAHAIGYAQRGGESLPFLFKGADGSLFHTTFVYTPKTDTWQWIMDGEENGKLQPFARLILTRQQ